MKTLDLKFYPRSLLFKKIKWITFGILLLLVSCFGNLIKASENKSSGTRFVVIGHLYPIINENERLQKLMRSISALNPDFVFILGDSSLHIPSVVNKLRDKFPDKVYFSPGNEEIKENKNAYFKNIGYFNKKINTDDARFILFNSSESAESIRRFLDKSLQFPSNNQISILLTHHRIWDDTLLSEAPFQHDKSYYFKELFPSIKDKVTAIFSGNSKRQYFTDISITPPSSGPSAKGKQNLNVVFWADKIGKIDAYSIGMGDGVPKSTYVSVDIIDGKLLIEPHYIQLKNTELMPLHLIDVNPGSFSKANIKKNFNTNDNKSSIKQKTNPSKFKKYAQRLTGKTFWLGVLFGILIAFCMICMFRSLFMNKKL